AATHGHVAGTHHDVGTTVAVEVDNGRARPDDLAVVEARPAWLPGSVVAEDADVATPTQAVAVLASDAVAVVPEHDLGPAVAVEVDQRGRGLHGAGAGPQLQPAGVVVGAAGVHVAVREPGHDVRHTVAVEVTHRRARELLAGDAGRVVGAVVVGRPATRRRQLRQVRKRHRLGRGGGDQRGRDDGREGSDEDEDPTARPGHR